MGNTLKKISSEKNWIIIDTCVISKFTTDKEIIEPIYKKIAKEIGEFTPVVTPLICFEYLRKTETKKAFEEAKETLSDFIEIELNTEYDIYNFFELSAELSIIYRYENKQHGKHIGGIDCVHGGLLRRYPKNLFLLTFDVNDFPYPLFNNICCDCVQIGKQLENWKLCNFNKDRFSELYKFYIKKE